MNSNDRQPLARIATTLAVVALAVYAFAQLPPMPVAEPLDVTADDQAHTCEPRLPVIFLKWNPPVGWTPHRYRIYSTTNPLAPLADYAFYAETPRTNLPVLTLGNAQEFFCVSAVRSDGKESRRSNE
jgi:hypothetical protein